jgi:hypothetical protein
VTLKDKGKQRTTKEKYLVVRVRLKYLGPSERVSYQSWGAPARAGEQTAPVLTDGSGKSYARKAFGPGVEVVGQVGQFSLFTGRSVEDRLIFEAPANPTDFLYLELPAAACSGTGTFRFAISRSLFRR